MSDTLRWRLASQGTGVTLPTFLALSESDFYYRYIEAVANQRHEPLLVHLKVFFSPFLPVANCIRDNIACCLLLRNCHNYRFVRPHLLPTDPLANIFFVNVYNQGYLIPIFGGLTPVNVLFIHGIPVSVIDLYFATWLYSILSSDQFITSIPCQSESGQDCGGIFLPGGVEIARLRQENLNQTLLDGGILSDSPVILIEDAPGFEVDYFALEMSFHLMKLRTVPCMDKETDRACIYSCVADINDFTIVAGGSDLWKKD